MDQASRSPREQKQRLIQATRELLPAGLYFAAIVSILETFLGDIRWIGKPLRIFSFWFIPIPVVDWFTVIVTLLLAWGLARRKHSAWVGTTIINVALLIIYVASFALTYGFADLVEGADLWLMCALATNILILVITLLLLWVHHRYYSVRSQPGNVARALTVFLAGSALVTAAGIAVLFMVKGAGWHQILALTAGHPAWLSSRMGLGWALCALAAMWVMLRTQHEAAQMQMPEEMRVRTLLAEYPGDSLGYFATRRDKSVLLTEHSGVTYRASMGVALASGDPLGDPSAWPDAARAFLRYASDYGLTPAVIGTSEAGARAYVQAGLKALHLGDEAILHPSHFRLAELPEVARAVRHMTKLGYTTRIRRHRAIAPQELARLFDLAEQWRDGDERGFSMALSRMADPSDGQCVMVEALFPDGDERGEVAALLSFVPWGSDGLSLDVMRRHPRADNGVTELMVASLMANSADVGVTKVSLNFVVFRSVFEQGSRIGASAFLSLWHRILLFASRWWQLESLYRSNQKYDPEWFPRLICYADAGDLPRVSVAMGVAEGFLTLPARLGGYVAPQARHTDEESAALLEVTTGARSTKKPVALSGEMLGRLASRSELLAQGIDPYPASVHVDTHCADVAALLQASTGQGADDAADPATSRQVSIAGRVMGIRDHGGVIFVDLRDWSGDAQVLLDRQHIGSEGLERLRRQVRSGDHLAASGQVERSATGTPSLVADSWQLASKALRPLPDKRHGLRDPEARVRLRHLALMTSRDQRRMIEARSRAIQAVRSGLLARGYLEVETPMLHPIHGGANARPFRTHINAYDLDLYLRIAPELYLKRLMVGGMDRVFEIGRSFRNEGADATHNPEFTMLEAYQAWADYNVMKDVVQGLIVDAAQQALGTTVVRGQVNRVEHEIDLAKPWRSISVCDAVAEKLGEPVSVDTDVATLGRYADAIGLNYDPAWAWGTMLQHLYEHLAEGTTAEPTFFTDFPAQTSPLTRPHRSIAGLAERWDLIIFGSEVGTAYSEMVDPVVQREVLTAQSLAAAGGDAEAMELDEAFLRALEAGMPPTGGLGLGLDRLVMTLTQASIRDTIAFPLVRPEG